MERHLAAILTLDVVGYSRAMGADEKGTLELLKSHRRELIEPKAAHHSGRTIKLMGDGTLMEFASAVDAVAFAVAVQLGMRERNASLPGDRRLEFRVGINIGDVILDGEDIYGDGVNIAARLEGLADPGGICIRRNVRNQVRGKLELDFDDLGELEIKNIERPVRVFKVLLNEKAEALATTIDRPELATTEAGSTRPRRPAIAAAAILLAAIIAGVSWNLWQGGEPPAQIEGTLLPLPDEPSIIVLPFVNLSGDETLGHVAEGFSTAIRTHLSKFPQIFVIAGSTASSFGEESLRARVIAREVGVRYVLEGSLQRAAEDIQINAELIEAEPEKTVWAEQYGFSPDDPFSIQADLIQQITSTLHVVIEEKEIAAVRRRPSRSSKAYDLYLRAIAEKSSLSNEGRRESIRLLEEACALDPDFLDAHLELSGRYLALWRFGGVDEPEEALRLARTHAERALQIDHSDYRGHYRLGMLHLFADHDHELAYAAFQRAVKDNPNDADILYDLGFLRLLMGESEEAIEWNDKAKRINPRYPGWYNFNAGLSHFFAKDYDMALSLAKTGIAVYPKALAPRRILIATLAEMGRLEQAQEEVAKYLEIEPDFKLSTFRNTPFQKAVDQNRYYRALRMAGLPD